jgi:hypothetical protein
MWAWNRRDLEIWKYGGCGGMEARSGGLEGVYMWRYGGLEGLQVCR